ncbi:MAG: signal peptidase II [Clostridia bacterium]|nr:signal peptidase II [Clostridia bacterium]
MLYLILWAAIAAVIVIADQLTKYLVIQHIPEGESIPVIQGVLHWTHIKNDGAIFGWFDDTRWLFMILSTVGIIVMIGMLVYWVKKEPKDKLMQVILTLLISGGIGNMIDRCSLGVVTDFIDFCAFPKLWMYIFNVADCAVTIGGGLMVLWLILSVIAEIKNKKAAVTLSEEQNGQDSGNCDAEG